MKIILLEDLFNYGKSGDIVLVKSGYARNFLIPYGKAMFYTDENFKSFQEIISLKKKKHNFLIERAKSYIEKINNFQSVEIKHKSGRNGKLFGSIGVRYIVKFINDLMFIKVFKNEVRLNKGIIKSTGSYEVNFRFYKDYTTKLIINVISDNN